MSDNTIEVRLRTEDMYEAVPLVRVPFTQEGIRSVEALIRTWGVYAYADTWAGKGSGQFVIGEDRAYYEWVVES